MSFPCPRLASELQPGCASLTFGHDAAHSLRNNRALTRCLGNRTGSLVSNNAWLLRWSRAGFDRQGDPLVRSVTEIPSCLCESAGTKISGQLNLFDLLENVLRQDHGGHRRRPSGVECEMGNHFDDFVLRDAILQRALKMKTQLLGAI